MLHYILEITIAGVALGGTLVTVVMVVQDVRKWVRKQRRAK